MFSLFQGTVDLTSIVRWIANAKKESVLIHASMTLNVLKQHNVQEIITKNNANVLQER